MLGILIFYCTGLCKFVQNILANVWSLWNCRACRPKTWKSVLFIYQILICYCLTVRTRTSVYFLPNLINYESEEWSSQWIQQDSNLWPPQYRCDALPTELWSHTLGARSICWVHFSHEEWNGVKNIWTITIKPLSAV